MFFGDEEKKKPRIVGFQIKSSDGPDDDDDASLRPPSLDPSDPDDQKYKKRPQTLSIWYSLVLLVYCFAIFYTVVLTDHRLPAPLTRQDAQKFPDRFIEERARVYLKRLTSVGARPAGSYENEVLAVDFLKRELQTIMDRANPVHRLTLDVQKPRGSFNLDFMDGLTHHYRNIQNVIVKVESGGGAKDALLINCHFDSVPQSPGASDDAVSCAIMLEMLDVLVQSDQPLRHNLIFLFNGAEENLLPGSHGFITQHEWASEVRAFINLEACGAGGRELVFQSGPNHPWMIEAYGLVAPYPFASVIGQEIFQSGIIPGDTDFRIFRDYGEIPGLDIAYMKNGFVYHTRHDTEDKIPLGSIQRAGDNVLAVVRHIANSEVLSHTAASSGGNVVFFDFLGLFLVHYPEWVGILINISVVVASFYCAYSKVQQSHKLGVGKATYINQLWKSFGFQIIGVLFAFLIVILIATFMDAIGRPMSWYSRPYLIFFLYVCPTLFAVAAVFHFALPRQKKDFHFVGGNWAIESLYFEVNRLVWTLFTLVMTLMRLQSSFFCMCWVLFPMLGRIVLERLYDQDPLKKKPKDWRWLGIHLGFLWFPLILSMCMIYNTYIMFIPIMGRSGSAINPDLLIGCKTVLMILATISYLSPLMMVVNRPYRIITVLYMTTLVTVILVAVTRLGFPYSGSSDNFAPHKALIFHTERQFFNKDNKIIEEDSGYFLINLDRNSPTVLFNHVPEMYAIEDIRDEDCEKHIYCGVPMYYPCSTMLRINNWIPAKKPKLYQTTDVELITKEKSGLNTLKLLFRAQGPDHMGIYFAPKKGISLVNWSFVEGEILHGPVWKDNRHTYFIYYSHGLSPTHWEFWLEFKVPKTYLDTDDLMDLAVAGHFVHGNEMKSPEFKQFLSQFPSWSEPVGWSVSYKTHVF